MLAGFVAVLALLLTACGGGGSASQESTTPPAADSAQPSEVASEELGGQADEPGECEQFDTISFGMFSPSAGYWIPLYADAAGLWQEACIQFDPVMIPSAANLVTAVTTGDLHAAAINADQGFSAIMEGHSLVAVASGQQTIDATFVGRREIESIADLRGKTVGTAAIASTSTLAMQGLLSAAGLSDGDYELVSGGGSAERRSALEGGAYDATWVLSPINLLMLADGYTDLGSLADSDIPPYLFNAVFIDPMWAQDNPDLMQRFMDVWVGAAKAFHDPSARGAFEDVLVDQVGATPEIAAATYDKFHEVGAIAPEAGIDTEMVFGTFELMLELERIDAVPSDVAEYVDLSHWSDVTGKPAPETTR